RRGGRPPPGSRRAAQRARPGLAHCVDECFARSSLSRCRCFTAPDGLPAGQGHAELGALYSGGYVTVGRRETRSAQFEGRLHQGDETSADVEAETTELRHCRGDREVAQVHRYDLDDVWDKTRIDGCQVVTLEVHDTRIAAQPATQLTGTGIDRIYA